MLDPAFAFFSMVPDELRHAYASLAETRLGPALLGTVSDFVSRLRKRRDTRGEAFQRRLSEAVQRDRTLPDEHILLVLLLDLCKYLDIPVPNLVAKQDCVDLCDRIAREAITLYAEQHPEETISSPEDLVRGVLTNVLANMDVPSSPEAVEEQAAAMEAFFATLPAEQREKIRERLGVDDLSKSMITRLIVQGSLGSLFAVAVDIAGFSAYKNAVVLLASAARLVGVTLPFVVYTTLTSLIAVVSNPIFLVATIGGSGALQYVKKERALRQKFIPVLVASILAGADPSRDLPAVHARMDGVVSLWQQNLSKYLKRRQALAALNAQLEAERKAVMEALARRNMAKTNKSEYESELATLTFGIASILASDERLLSRLVDLEETREQAQHCLELRARLAVMREEDSASEGAGSESEYFSRKQAREGLIRNIESESRKAAEALVRSIPGPVPAWLGPYMEGAIGIKASLAAAEDRIASAQQETDASIATRDSLQKQVSQLEAVHKTHKREMPALEQVAGRLGGSDHV